MTNPHDLPSKPQGDAQLVDDLSIRELRVANGKLRGDCVEAITGPTADRWDALALVGWLWHKRIDSTASLTLWQDMTAGQLATLLGLSDDQGVDQVDDVDQGDDGDEQLPAAEWSDPTHPEPSP